MPAGGSIAEEAVRSLVLDRQGNVFVGGITSGRGPLFSPNTGTRDTDIILLKLSSEGALLWLTQLHSGQTQVANSQNEERLHAIGLDPSGESLFFFGATEGDFVQPNEVDGLSDIVLGRIGANDGSIKELTQVGATEGFQGHVPDTVTSLATSDDQILLAGGFRKTDPVLGTTTVGLAAQVSDDLKVVWTRPLPTIESQKVIMFEPGDDEEVLSVIGTNESSQEEQRLITVQLDREGNVVDQNEISIELNAEGRAVFVGGDFRDDLLALRVLRLGPVSRTNVVSLFDVTVSN